MRGRVRIEIRISFGVRIRVTIHARSLSCPPCVCAATRLIMCIALMCVSRYLDYVGLAVSH